MGKRRKTLQELTIMDSFLFGAVMMDPENCRILLECILEIPIKKVKVIQEKSLIYHPEYRGIRLDVFAEDEDGTHFDVEVQTRTTPIEMRSRYYHSQMDMEMLLSGVPYDKLPESYVIFICNYDPLRREKYRYEMKTICVECPEEEYHDGVHTIILNNRGKNPEEVPKELVSFLEFTKQSLPESEKESEDAFVKRLQETIREIKGSREMGERYMTLQELLQEEHAEGHAEGRKEERKDIFLQLVAEGEITLEKGARELGISEEEFRNMLEKHRNIED